MTSSIRLRGPADLLSTLPYQLGFYPEDSVVVVSMHGRRLGLVQRVDLPEPGGEQDLCRVVRAALWRDLPDTVVVIGYESVAGRSAATVDALSTAIARIAVRVADRLVVRDGRWYCLSPGCACPAEGVALPHAEEVPAVADFVGMGRMPRASRRDLVRALAAPRGPGAEALGALATDLGSARILRVTASPQGRREQRAEELAMWGELLRGAVAPSPPVEGPAVRRPAVAAAQDDGPAPGLARLAVSLSDVILRDLLIAWLCPGTLDLGSFDDDLVRDAVAVLPPVPWSGADDGQGAIIEDFAARNAVEAALIELCAALPDHHRAPALTVLASFTWWRGDGALTRVALDEALSADPDYRLALLLERLVDYAIRTAQPA